MLTSATLARCRHGRERGRRPAGPAAPSLPHRPYHSRSLGAWISSHINSDNSLDRLCISCCLQTCYGITLSDHPSLLPNGRRVTSRTSRRGPPTSVAMHFDPYRPRKRNPRRSEGELEAVRKPGKSREAGASATGGKTGKGTVRGNMNLIEHTERLPRQN